MCHSFFIDMCCFDFRVFDVTTTRPPISTLTDTLLPSTAVFRSEFDQQPRAAGDEQGPGVADERVLVELEAEVEEQQDEAEDRDELDIGRLEVERDRKSTRLNSSH